MKTRIKIQISLIIILIFAFLNTMTSSEYEYLGEDKTIINVIERRLDNPTNTDFTNKQLNTLISDKKVHIVEDESFPVSIIPLKLLVERTDKTFILVGNIIKQTGQSNRVLTTKENSNLYSYYVFFIVFPAILIIGLGIRWGRYKAKRTKSRKSLVTAYLLYIISLSIGLLFEGSCNQNNETGLIAFAILITPLICLCIIEQLVTRSSMFDNCHNDMLFLSTLYLMCVVTLQMGYIINFAKVNVSVLIQYALLQIIVCFVGFLTFEITKKKKVIKNSS